MKKNLKSGVCKCGTKVRLDRRSTDQLESGRCNRCIRAAIRPIAWRDKTGQIYTLCTACGKAYRFTRKKGYGCKIDKSSKKAAVGKSHSKLEVGKYHKKSEVGESSEIKVDYWNP